MTVICPLAALAAPPDTGASIMPMPIAASRAASDSANSGATVALAITTDPARIAPAAPPSPSSTPSVCCAFTTSVSTTSQAAPSSAGVAQATPPSAAKAANTSRRTSQAWVRNPARSSDRATPMPIAPRPMTPTFLFMPTFRAWFLARASQPGTSAAAINQAALCMRNAQTAPGFTW